MSKKIILFSFLYLAFSFAYAFGTCTDKRTIPGREQQEKNEHSKVIQTEVKGYEQAIDDDEEDLLIEALSSEAVKGAIEKRDVPKAELKDEVQSFNFLYYLIHHFKFSDFITE